MSSKRLKEKVALITGASRGIGRAIATKFADEGADMFLCATNMEKLQETKEKASKSGCRIELQSVDMADRNGLAKMVQNAIELFGGIDILVNNAGIYKPAPFTEYTYEDFDNIMKVNLYGPFFLTQDVLKHMLDRRKGKIINVASTAGKWASMNQSAYNISKHGLIGMTRCLGLETAQAGICVNAICPGLVETKMMTSEFSKGHAKLLGVAPQKALDWVMQRVPMGRWLKPEEIAHLAVYLASDESNGMTGQSILLDGGMLYI